MLEKFSVLLQYRELARRHGLDALMRLIVVSAVQNGSFYLLALIEIAIGFKSWQTFAVNYPLAVAISFLMNRSWVFAGRARPKGQLARYIAVYVVVYFLAMALADFWERVGFHPALAVLFTMIPIAIGLFLVLHLWVFPHERAASEIAVRDA